MAYTEPAEDVRHTEFHPDIVAAEIALWAAVDAETISASDLKILSDHAVLGDSFYQIAAKRVLKRLAHAVATTLSLTLAEPELQDVSGE
jgi:hypothetical protein